MILKKVHADFWRQHQSVPKWVVIVEDKKRSFEKPGDLINACVNQHAYTEKQIRSKYDYLHVHNLCAILKMVRKRMNNNELLEYLDGIALNPGTVIDPEKRAAFAKKWVQRIRKSRENYRGNL